MIGFLLLAEEKDQVVVDCPGSKAFSIRVGVVISQVNTMVDKVASVNTGNKLGDITMKLSD